MAFMDDSTPMLMDPGIAMAFQGLENMGNLRRGQPTVSPIKAYQDMIAQRAQMNQQSSIGRLRDAQTAQIEQDVARGGNKLGTYNPRDYTTESWTEFASTNDPSVLVRHDPFTAGGVRFDEAGNPVVDPNQIAQYMSQQAGAKTQAMEFAKNKETWLASEPKLLGSIDSAKSKAETVSDTISEIRPLLSEWSTGYGGLISSLPETEAKRLRNLLDTVRANVAFSTLQDMRANSPSGGALGQVSERELDLLMSAIGSLDQTGDMNDLEKVLDRIERVNMGAIDRMENAYGMDKGRYNPSEKAPEANVVDWSEL